MPLVESDRQTLHMEYMRTLSRRRDGVGLTKTELKAAIDAIDDWIDANTASFNQGLPLPARTALSAKKKAELFMFVLRRRFEVG